MDFQSIPSPGAPWQHHKETMISLPPLRKNMKGSPAQPATAAMQLASLPSQPACNCLTRNPGPDLSCKQEWKGGSRHASIPCSHPAPRARCSGWREGKEIAKGRWKSACQESAGEREPRLILMQRVAEKGDRKQDQADRKVAGFLGAFCKHRLSVAAFNLIISTRATA